MTFRRFFLFALLFLSACGTTTPPQTPPALDSVSPTFSAPTNNPPPFLHVQGRDILDASGQPVLLRGVNMDTYYWAYTWDPTASLTYATQADIQYLDELGATVIRLSLHWRYFDTSLGYDLIDSYLDWCEQAGIYVILDMHVVPPEDDILEGRMWDDPAAQQKFLDLWTDIASRYAENAIVAGYDLYNEPAPSDPAQWWDLARRAVTAIRAVDSNHILFVENPLGDDDTFQLIADPNVVYSYHDYQPFLVSHAGAGWVADSPIPSDYSYPGQTLTGIDWADWAEDAASLNAPATEWQPFDSGVLTVPPGVEFATLKPSADGNVGAVWFDDLTLDHNGVPQTIYNPGMEEASINEADRPANWFFWSDSGFSGEWSDEHAHSGNYSLKITSDGDGFGVWTQSEWLLTAPLVRVQPGDTLQARGWIYAPDAQRNGGSASVTVDYLNGVYENWDRERLREHIQPYLDWSAAHNVPLFVGEFGATPASPGDSRYTLLADKISLMNEAGLHWALWSYREPASGKREFGLYFGADVDERLADILRQGFISMPEAATTPTITLPPGAVDVSAYGAMCDGATNDTDAFAAASEAINQQGGGILWLPPNATCVVGKQTFVAGEGYRPAPIIHIHDCADPVTIMGNGARLLAADGLRFGSFDPHTGEPYTPPEMPFTEPEYRADAYNMLFLVGNQSVTVTNVELDGNIDGLILGGDWGDTGWQTDANGILAIDNQNLTIQNVYTHHHGLDGVQIAHYGLTPASPATPMLLDGVVSEYNARQGLSWVGGIGLTARNSQFNHTGKARFSSAPGAGVDIEAEDSVNRNGLFENCEFVNNTGAGLVADSGDSANITVRDSSFWGITNYSIWSKKPYMRFENCDFHGTAISAYGSKTEPESANQFINSTFDDLPHPLYGQPYIFEALVDLEGSDSPNVTFDGCAFTATQSQSFMILAEELDNPVIIKNSSISHQFHSDLQATFQGVFLQNVHFSEEFDSPPSSPSIIDAQAVRVGENVLVDGTLVTFLSLTGLIPPGDYIQE